MAIGISQAHNDSDKNKCNDDGMRMRQRASEISKWDAIRPKKANLINPKQSRNEVRFLWSGLGLIRRAKLKRFRLIVSARIAVAIAIGQQNQLQ